MASKFFSKSQRKYIIYPLIVLLLFALFASIYNLFFERFEIKNEAYNKYISKVEAKNIFFTKTQIVSLYPSKQYIEKHYLTIANANIYGGEIKGIRSDINNLNQNVSNLDRKLETLIRINLGFRDDIKKISGTHIRDTSNDIAIVNYQIGELK